MTTSGTSASSLSTFIEDSGCCGSTASQESQFVSFQKYVEEAGSDAESGTGVMATDPEAGQVSSSSASSDPETEQDSQSGTQSLANQLSSTVATYSSMEVTDSSAVDESCVDPSIKAVRDAMTAAGLDPGSVKMTYHTVDVYFLTGGWVNEILTVETSDGRTQDFSAVLSERSPEVTVCDIRHMLEGTGGWATLS